MTSSTQSDPLNNELLDSHRKTTSKVQNEKGLIHVNETAGATDNLVNIENLDQPFDT